MAVKDSEKEVGIIGLWMSLNSKDCWSWKLEAMSWKNRRGL